MDLTPEERRRIYEEEKAKLRSAPRSLFKVLGYVLAVVVAALALASVGYLVWQNGRQRGELEALTRSAPAAAGPAGAQSPTGADTKSEHNDESVSEEEKTQFATAEEGFKADDGCRDLYLRIRDEGGQSGEAIAKHLQAADSSIRPAQVVKNPIPYYGKPVAVSGRVMQVREYPARDGSYFTDLYMYWGDEILVASVASQVPFVRGDRVVVVGYLANHLYRYTTVSQWQMAVPLVIARVVLRLGEVSKYRVKMR